MDRLCILNGLLKSLKLGPLNRLAGAFGSLKGLLVVLITMQGVGPWVEGSPHWKQSKLYSFYCLMRLWLPSCLKMLQVRHFIK